MLQWRYLSNTVKQVNIFTNLSHKNFLEIFLLNLFKVMYAFVQPVIQDQHV